MKNIFPTIEYVAEKIKEAITGHKNDEQAHPNLSEQINVLSNEKMDKNKDNITEKGLTIDNWLTIDGDTGGKSNFLCNLYNDNDGNYRYVNSHGGGSGAGFRTSIFDRKPKFIYSTDIAATKDEIANIVEIDLATTDKTDISFPFDVGYETQTNYQSRIIKYSNNTGLMIVSVKKTDGTEFVAGSNINICNALPVGFKAKYNEGTSCRGEQPNTIASVLIYNQRVLVTPLANCKVIMFTLSYEIGG